VDATFHRAARPLASTVERTTMKNFKTLGRVLLGASVTGATLLGGPTPARAYPPPNPVDVGAGVALGAIGIGAAIGGVVRAAQPETFMVGGFGGSGGGAAFGVYNRGGFGGWGGGAGYSPGGYGYGGVGYATTGYYPAAPTYYPAATTYYPAASMTYYPAAPAGTYFAGYVIR
jgi:hypothetical protein